MQIIHLNYICMGGVPMLDVLKRCKKELDILFILKELIESDR